MDYEVQLEQRDEFTNIKILNVVSYLVVLGIEGYNFSRALKFVETQSSKLTT
jgi:hypothetical protein